MRNRFELDPEGAHRANSLRAFVATLGVLGLASLMWAHGGAVGALEESAGPPISLLAATPADDPGSLRAPTTDSSLPPLDTATFRNADAPAEAPVVPTF